MNITQAIILVIIILVMNGIVNGVIYKNSTQNVELSRKNKNESFNLSSSAKSLLTVIALLPLFSGLWAVNYWFSEYNTARDTVNWTPVHGTILSKDIASQVSRSNTSNNVSTSHTTVTYYPTVEYLFTYKGHKHKGSTLDYFNQPSYGDQSKSEFILDKIPDVGQNVTVYVKPDGTNAVLFQGTDGTSYFGILAGIPFFIIGLLGIKWIHGL